MHVRHHQDIYDKTYNLKKVGETTSGEMVLGAKLLWCLWCWGETTKGENRGETTRVETTGGGEGRGVAGGMVWGWNVFFTYVWLTKAQTSLASAQSDQRPCCLLLVVVVYEYYKIPARFSSCPVRLLTQILQTSLFETRLEENRMYHMCEQQRRRFACTVLAAALLFAALIKDIQSQASKIFWDWAAWFLSFLFAHIEDIFFLTTRVISVPEAN